MRLTTAEKQALAVYHGEPPRRRWFGRKQLRVSDEFLSTLRALGTPQLPVYQAMAHDVTAADYGMIWQTQSAVRTVVDFIARNIAQMNLKVYRRVANETRLELNDHGLANLIQNPNPFTTRYRMMHGTVSDLCIFDNAFWAVITSSRGSIATVRLPPSMITVRGDWMHPTSYVVRPRMGSQGQEQVLPAEQVVHFRGYNANDERVGISPLESLRQILQDEIEIAEGRRSLWKRAARMEGVIERPEDAPDWSDVARERFRQDWQGTYAGADRAGLTGILEEGMKFVPYSFDPKEAEYVAGRRLALEEVARAYHIKMDASTMGGNASLAAAQEGHRNLYQDTFGPWLEFIEEEVILGLQSWVPDMTGIYVEFNINDKLKGSFEEQARTLTTSVGGPWVTRNEARARMNLAPHAGGDELIIPLNVTVGGQPAPTIPTEVPQPKSEPGFKSYRSVIMDMRAKYEDVHSQVLVRTFARQKNAWEGKKEFNRERWDTELGDDLFGVSLQMGNAGAGLAEEKGMSLDVQRMVEHFTAETTGAAKRINEATAGMLSDETDLDVVFGDERVRRTAEERTTSILGFITQEIAQQNVD